MKAKIYIGAKKYALYIGRKIVEKTLEFLTLPARFVSKKVQDLKNLTMWGQSVQNGTPTPTTPIEIESVGDKTKNLLNNDNIVYGNLSSSGTISRATTTRICSELIPVEYNKTYICSGKTYQNGVYVDTKWIIAEYDTTKAFILNSRLVVNRQSFIIQNSNAKYIRVCAFTEDNTNPIELDKNLVQLEEGTTATSYEPYGYKVPVVVGGKNLFDGEIELGGLNVVTGLEVTNPGRTRSSNFISVKPNTTYTFTRTDGVNRWVLGYDENKNIVTDGTEYASQGRYGALVQSGSVFIFRFKTTPTTKYIKWYDTGCTNITETIQLELGNTATEYQPYIEPTTTNIYLNEPLRKIGEYTDTLSVDGTEVTVVRNVWSDNLKEKTWERHNSSDDYISWKYNTSSEPTETKVVAERGIGFCEITNYYQFVGGRENRVCWAIGSNMVTKYLVLPPTIASSIEEFNQYIISNDYHIIYPIATPTTETYTIESPINLPQGTLTIDTDTTIKPSKIEITGDIDNE